MGDLDSSANGSDYSPSISPSPADEKAGEKARRSRALALSLRAKRRTRSHSPPSAGRGATKFSELLIGPWRHSAEQKTLGANGGGNWVLERIKVREHVVCTPTLPLAQRATTKLDIPSSYVVGCRVSSTSNQSTYHPHELTSLPNQHTLFSAGARVEGVEGQEAFGVVGASPPSRGPPLALLVAT